MNGKLWGQHKLSMVISSTSVSDRSGMFGMELDYWWATFYLVSFALHVGDHKQMQLGAAAEAGVIAESR